MADNLMYAIKISDINQEIPPTDMRFVSQQDYQLLQDKHESQVALNNELKARLSRVRALMKETKQKDSVIVSLRDLERALEDE